MTWRKQELKSEAMLSGESRLKGGHLQTGVGGCGEHVCSWRKETKENKEMEDPGEKSDDWWWKFPVEVGGMARKLKWKEIHATKKRRLEPRLPDSRQREGGKYKSISMPIHWIVAQREVRGESFVNSIELSQSVTSMISLILVWWVIRNADWSLGIRSEKEHPFENYLSASDR